VSTSTTRTVPTLQLAKRGGSRLAVVDTTSFKVTAYAKP
jgi:hypothetical protein